MTGQILLELTTTNEGVGYTDDTCRSPEFDPVVSGNSTEVESLRFYPVLSPARMAVR